MGGSSENRFLIKFSSFFTDHQRADVKKINSVHHMESVQGKNGEGKRNERGTKERCCVGWQKRRITTTDRLCKGKDNNTQRVRKLQVIRLWFSLAHSSLGVITQARGD